MQVGVGFSELHDTAAATTAAVQAAMSQAGVAAGQATLVLLFTTARHDPQQIGPVITSLLGEQVRIVGGYGVGIITHTHLAYDGWQLGVAIFAGAELAFEVLHEMNLPGNEYAAGQSIGRRLGPLAATDNLVLLYDSVKFVDGQPRLNMVSPFINGFETAIATAQGTAVQWPHLAGMGMLGDMQLSPTWQWVGPAQPVQASAMALRFRSPLQMHTTIMHGCRPAGRYYTITKTDGPVVLEIDNRPALDAIGEMLGPEAGLSWDDYAFFVTLGVNRGDPFGPFREEDYANRMCIAVDAARKGLVMFEDDLMPGMKVQLMRRSMDFAYIGQRTSALLDSIKTQGRKPVFALYIDCAGRAGAYCGMDEEDAVEVQKAVPANVPLLGVYSGVEIAMVAGRPQALDWTGVLCVFSI